jgi:flagellar basal-body rod protein FlgC
VELNYLNGMRVSASGLAAQRRQMDVAAENLAQMHTTRTDEGGPYRRQVVEFSVDEEAAAGKPVQITSVESSLRTTQTGHRGTVRHVGAPGDPRLSQVGVSGSEDQSDFLTVHDPGHPDANEFGEVQLPNVDLAQEMVTMMVASRAYEANVAALGSAKAVAEAALDLAR